MTATTITQRQVALLAREGRFTTLAEADAALVAGIVEKRLLEALCRESAPVSTDEDYDLWLMLLAQAITVSDDVATSEGVQSESVRNYSYTLRTDSGTWADLSRMAGDLLAHFSQCEGSVAMQTDVTCRQYGAYEIPQDWPVGGAL